MGADPPVARRREREAETGRRGAVGSGSRLPAAQTAGETGLQAGRAGRRRVPGGLPRAMWRASRLRELHGRGGIDSTVVRELNTLEKRGYIVRKRRPMADGKRLTTVYYLGDTPEDRRQPAPQPESKLVDNNITPHQTRKSYKTPESDAAVAELVEKFGRWRGTAG